MNTVLSPHFDDAAYALAITLARIAYRGETIEVVNCFTQSEHAPQIEGEGLDDVSGLRAQEDAEFARTLGPTVTSRGLGFPDTSARPGYGDVSLSFHRRNFTEDEAGLCKQLILAFSQLPDEGPVFTPLAYGNHVDHRLVRAAAEEVFPAHRLVYFEDMPYSASAARRMLRKKLARKEFEPVLCQVKAHEVEAKAFALECYASQLTAEHRDFIVGRARMLGGERLWLKTKRYAESWS